MVAVVFGWKLEVMVHGSFFGLVISSASYRYVGAGGMAVFVVGLGMGAVVGFWNR
jgi:hypothetical protein